MIVLPGAIPMDPDVSFSSLGVSDTSLGTMMSRKMGCGFQKQVLPRSKYSQMRYNQTPHSGDTGPPQVKE